jgi:hypothetical protein
MIFQTFRVFWVSMSFSHIRVNHYTQPASECNPNPGARAFGPQVIVLAGETVALGEMGLFCDFLFCGPPSLKLWRADKGHRDSLRLFEGEYAALSGRGGFVVFFLPGR